MSFPQFLIENGWLCHRKKFDGKNWIYELCEFKNDYSTLQKGKLDYRFLKDGKEIIFGLNDNRKPDLLWPKPDYSKLPPDEIYNLTDWKHGLTNEEILNVIL